jgi:hypothetical protein
MHLSSVANTSSRLGAKPLAWQAMQQDLRPWSVKELSDADRVSRLAALINIAL